MTAMVTIPVDALTGDARRMVDQVARLSSVAPTVVLCSREAATMASATVDDRGTSTPHRLGAMIRG